MCPHADTLFRNKCYSRPLVVDNNSDWAPHTVSVAPRGLRCMKAQLYGDVAVEIEGGEPEPVDVRTHRYDRAPSLTIPQSGIRRRNRTTKLPLSAER